MKCNGKCRVLSFMLLVFLVLPGLLVAMPANHARHLLDRTGFGATPEEIDDLSKTSYIQAINQIVDAASDTRIEVPYWVEYEPVDILSSGGLNPAEKRLLRGFMSGKIDRKRVEQLQAWWLLQMMKTSSPLKEKMGLFWHNHFVTQSIKIKDPLVLWRYVDTLRRHALGNFRELLNAMARDPAMLGYLDNHLNKKGHPNENWARELLELFTLGEGNYTEMDVQEAARAFTGWSFDRRIGRFVFNRKLHDYGEKTFMGKKGAFSGQDIIEIILKNPDTAKFLVEKLWREFVSPDPNEKEIARLAKLFRDKRYEIKPLLKEMFNSPGFRAKKNHGSLIKSPVEFVLGTARKLKLPIDDGTPFIRLTNKLGQQLLNPPNVAGWPGYTDWIDADSLLKREEVLNKMWDGLSSSVPKKRKKGCKSMKAEIESVTYPPPLDLYLDLDNEEGRKKITETFLPIKGKTDVTEPDLKQFLRSLMLDSAYQLK